MIFKMLWCIGLKSNYIIVRISVCNFIRPQVKQWNNAVAKYYWGYFEIYIASKHHALNGR